MLENGGGLPSLFNYEGLKFALLDILGDFDKDRKGNIIIRRDKDNIMIDKKGMKVNKKGYLIDDFDNIVNKEGTQIFAKEMLKQDNEIPKFFHFIKFNIKDIIGDFEIN